MKATQRFHFVFFLGHYVLFLDDMVFGGDCAIDKESVEVLLLTGYVVDVANELMMLFVWHLVVV